MHACAPGKCYLASLPDPDLLKWVRHPLAQVTRHTTTLAPKLLKELSVARQRGYVVDRGEFVPGAGAVAAPMTDEAHNLVAVLALAAPTVEITAAAIARWLPLMRSASTRLSQAFRAIGGAVGAQ